MIYGDILVPPSASLKGTTGASPITNTTSTAIIGAQGTNIKMAITQILVVNGHATTSTRVDILDGSTIIYAGFAQAAGGGFSVTFPVNDPLLVSANAAINAQAATTGASVTVSIKAYSYVDA